MLELKIRGILEDISSEIYSQCNSVSVLNYCEVCKDLDSELYVSKRGNIVEEVHYHKDMNESETLRMAVNTFDFVVVSKHIGGKLISKQLELHINGQQLIKKIGDEIFFDDVQLKEKVVVETENNTTLITIFLLDEYDNEYCSTHIKLD